MVTRVWHSLKMSAALTNRFARAPEVKPLDRLVDFVMCGTDLRGLCQGFDQLVAHCDLPENVRTQLVAVGHEVWKYFHSTSKAQAKELWDLKVYWAAS